VKFIKTYYLLKRKSANCTQNYFNGPLNIDMRCVQFIKSLPGSLVIFIA